MGGDPNSRAQSIASGSILTAEDTTYDNVDPHKLYEVILKVLILEYRNEARFRTPIPVDPATSVVSPQSSNVTSNSSSASLKSKFINGNEGIEDATLPSHLIPSLEKRLNLIALKKSDSQLDEMTRRSLLRLYSELLDPRFKAEVKRVNKPEYLVMKFVSSADKELVKMGTVPQNEISATVFKQTGAFVQILISLVSKDKNGEQITAKLQAYKESLKPKGAAIASPKTPNSTPSSSSMLGASSSLKYPQPSFRVADMDQAMINLLSNLFSVDKVKIQQDVFKFKDLAQEKCLHKDIQQVQFYLGKDLGQLSEKSFSNRQYYEEWKAREQNFCDQLLAKYQIPSAMKLISIPPLPSGEDFYILPTTQLSRSYFVVLLKRCFEYEQSQQGEDPLSMDATDARLFSKHILDLISHCSRFWRIDFPTRATALYTAAHLTDILKDNLGYDPKSKDPRPIDLNKTITLFHFCKRIIEDLGKLDWDEKISWSLKDQEIWFKNLLVSYNDTFIGIKDLIGLIFSKRAPKFGPYLQFLGDYLEPDALFFKVEETGIVKKWEKKLSKTLLRVSETRYAELLTNLPRDNTLNILHILNISDSIVEDIKLLQKRYKNPLLGFLDVPRTVAAVITGMFASDSKNILRHINSYAKQKQEPLPYGDAMEAYKSLYEIRDIFNQVSYSSSSNGNTSGMFKFDLESFFYPFLEEWVSESGEKIRSIINEAIARDEFQAIDLEDDNKKFSSSVLDIFVLVKEYLKILKNLNWSNEYQAAKTYTTLLKSVSEGVLTYASKISEKISKALDEEETKRDSTGLELPVSDATEQRKSGGWFDEVKNVVSSIQNGQSKSLETAEPYNFKPETCIAMNNLSAMMLQLTKLEDFLDPEKISNTVAMYEPNINKKYTSHVFSVRIVRAENVKLSSSSSSASLSGSSNLHPYITLIDTKLRKSIAKTRVIDNTDNPEWDEEFELTIPANSSLTISATVWNQTKFGTHSICGRALLQLDPRNFKHDGLPQDVYLDLDTQGRVLLEVAVESEREDAIFVMGRAHRSLKRAQERCIKLIVQKFARFIRHCFSRGNLKSICGSNGNTKPTQDEMDKAMMPLYEYLNDNLQVLAEYLSKDLLMEVMLAAWFVVISSADELLLPKLTSAKTFNLSSLGSRLNLSGAGHSRNESGSGWQSSITTAMANVGNTIGISGFGKSLTNSEIETVFSWLNFLCLDFFHNNGNGPPIRDLKNSHYQSLLLLPVYYDRDIEFLTSEVERLSPAFIQSLRDRNNFDRPQSQSEAESSKRGVGRAGSIVRRNTIGANATARARAKADQEAQEARSDPISAQTSAEEIILRVLLIKEAKEYVAKRLEQRERLAHSISTERLARAAAEGVFKRP